MERIPKLKAISYFGFEYDAIDTAAAVERDIIVTQTPDVLNDDVTNTAILLLACSRNLIQNEAFLRAKRWEKEGSAPLPTSVHDKLMGTVGFGREGALIPLILKLIN